MVQTEIITGDELKRYLGLVETTEILGMEEGRFTLFGCFDDETGEAVGILAAEVLGLVINIKRIFVLPKYRRKGVAKQLLSAVADLPEELRMPIIAYGVREELNIRFLSAMGFKETTDDFSCFEGKLGDFKKFPLPGEDGGYSVIPVEMATEDMINDFAMKTGMEKGVYITDLLLREDPFCDGSILCLKDGAVAALMILDESDRKIEIPFAQGDDPKAVFYCFSALHEELSGEYGPDAKLRFILYKGKGREVIPKIIDNAVEKEMYFFEMGRGND